MLSAADQREAAFGERLLARLDVVAFEADDERDADVRFARGIDDAMAMTLQSMMPPKMLTRMPSRSCR